MNILLLPRSLPNVISKIYFCYSFLVLILRLSSTFIIASSVDEHAKKPLKVFLTIPSEGWCQELQRFFGQIKTETSGVSGKGLFLVTRKLLLRMCAVLITYVLFLIWLFAGLWNETELLTLSFLDFLSWSPNLDLINIWFSTYRNASFQTRFCISFCLHPMSWKHVCHVHGWFWKKP